LPKEHAILKRKLTTQSRSGRSWGESEWGRGKLKLICSGESYSKEKIPLAKKKGDENHEYIHMVFSSTSSEFVGGRGLRPY